MGTTNATLARPHHLAHSKHQSCPPPARARLSATATAPPASAPAPRATAARTRTRRAAAARPRMPWARTSARARRRPTATAATTASATAVARRAPPSDYAPGAVRSTRGPRIQDSLEWGCGVPTMGCVVLEGARVNCPRSLLVEKKKKKKKKKKFLALNPLL